MAIEIAQSLPEAKYLSQVTVEYCVLRTFYPANCFHEIRLVELVQIRKDGE